MRRLRALLPLLMLAAVPLMGAPAAVAGGGSCHADATDASERVVVIDQFCFGPTVTRVPVGSRVTWTNKDVVSHVVVGLGYRWGTNSELNQGQTFSAVFDTAGIYPYTCYLHPGMTAAVVVGKANVPASGVLGSDPLSDGSVSRDAPAPKAVAPEALAARSAASTSSAGPWPATTAIGFALAFVFGLGLILQRRRTRPMPEIEG